MRNATGNSMSDKRRPRRAGRADDNLYRAARQAGLRGLANKFSITAAQLGEAITGEGVKGKFQHGFCQPGTGVSRQSYGRVVSTALLSSRILTLFSIGVRERGAGRCSRLAEIESSMIVLVS